MHSRIDTPSAKGDDQRFLTESELRILSEEAIPVIRQLSEHFTSWLWKKRVEETFDRLKTLQIPREKSEKLKKCLTEKFHDSLMCPGENIGLIAAQSILERCTQVILNAFDGAGLKAGGKHVSEIRRLLQSVNGSRNIKFKVGASNIIPDFLK
jgi:hypothetical protein